MIWGGLFKGWIAGLSQGFFFEMSKEIFHGCVVPVVDWLITNPQEGNMFNEFTWGIFALQDVARAACLH